jgi:RimJ/RimL family protein N-acetyltransferase
MTLPIETERLLLRRYILNDIDDIVELMSHPSVARVGTQVKASVAEVRKHIEQQNSLQPFELNKCFDLAIELKEEGKVIGFLGLINKDHHQGEVGWALHVGYRRKGYATEAAGALISHGFKKLGLHRIFADCSSLNSPSLKVMERLGMRREGHLREAEFEDGRWIDIIVYAVLADEWRPA